jgi:hypothetical protein
MNHQSATPESNEVSNKHAIIALFGAFALGLLLRSQIAAIPFERDEGEYAYIAQRWLQGEVPYKESFDQKPPGVFVAYACTFLLFGTSAAAVHWALQLYTLATIACVFMLGRKLYSTTVGICAAYLCALMPTSSTLLGNSANTEFFMILPMTAAMLTTLRATSFRSASSVSLGWGFLTGVLAAAAILFKQVAITNLFFSGVYFLMYGTRRWLLLGSLFLGALALVLPVNAYFWVKDAWSEFYDCVIGHNLRYTATLSIADYAGNFLFNIREILQVHWPIYLFAGFRLASVLSKRFARQPQQVPREDLTLILWLAFCVWGISIGGYFREHYFVQAIPGLAVLAGRGMVELAQRVRAGFGRSAIPYLLCATAIAYAVWMESWYYLPGAAEEKCRFIYGDFPFPQSEAIGLYLAAHSAPEDTVLVIGSEPQILYYAHRKTATRYIFFYPITRPTEDARLRQRNVLEELRARPPKFVVGIFVSREFDTHLDGPQDVFDGVHRDLKESYHVVGVVPVDEDQRGFRRLHTDPSLVERWKKRPFWYDTPEDKWWSVVVIWRRDEEPRPGLESEISPKP